MSPLHKRRITGHGEMSEMEIDAPDARGAQRSARSFPFPRLRAEGESPDTSVFRRRVRVRAEDERSLEVGLGLGACLHHFFFRIGSVSLLVRVTWLDLRGYAVFLILFPDRWCLLTSKGVYLV